MLSDREFLLLCQIANIGILNKKETSISEIAKLLLSTQGCDDIALFKEVAICSNFEELKLKCSKKEDGVNVFILEDLSGNDFVVFVGKQSLKCLEDRKYNEIYDFVKRNVGREKCYITGLKMGGIYAANIASRLEVEALIFGTPSMEELAGKVTNFVAENEPVGKFLEKVVFVKQKTISENIDEPYHHILLFDESGKVIEGVQTEYSKFCSWFYSNAVDIDNKVWEMFFRNKSEDDELINKDIYSLYYRVSELNEDRVKNALRNVVKYIEEELEKNIKPLKSEIQKNLSDVEAQDFFESICKKAENATQSAVEIVKGIYRSVETLLAGVGVFSLGSYTIDTLILMEQFKEDTDRMLDNEEQRITDFLKTSKERYIEMLSCFPEFGIPADLFED